MRKLLTLVLVCALLLAAMPAALAQTVAPGAKVTLEFPFSGKAANLVHAIYTIPAGLTFVEGEVDGWTYGKAGKTQAIYASAPAGISGGTLKLTLKADPGANGALAVAVTHLQGYVPGGWFDLTAAEKTKTVTVSGGATSTNFDVDRDGEAATLLDVMYALSAYLGDTSVEMARADFDGDGEVTLLEVMDVLAAYLQS